MERGESTSAREVAEFLAARDAPCPACGYNLRGLKGDACPECSQKLVLTVSLEHPVSRAWLGCILPLWIVGGAFALGGAIVWGLAGGDLARDIRRGGLKEEMFWFSFYPLIAAAVLIPPAVILTKRRGRRWLAMRTERTPSVLACIIGSMVVLLAWVGWLASKTN